MAETPYHFFKIIRPSTLQDKKLGIPSKFVKKYGNDLSNVATLIVPNGCVWKVKLTKDGRKFWFDAGWHDFVEYHSISTGYFLLFRYGKNSNFHVLIFDMSACEIQYPHYRAGLANDNHQNELEADDSVEIIGSLTPKQPAVGSALEMNRCKKPTASLESPKFKRHYEARSKRCKMEELVGIDKSDSIGDGSELRNIAYDVGTHSSDEANKRTTFDEHDILAIFEEMGISVCRNFRNVAAKEKERTITAARLFRPKSPSFMVILQPRNIDKELYVPSQFTVKYLKRRNSRLIKLEDCDGREWLVKLDRKRCRGGVNLSQGWITFAKDKNLKEGDICIFELIREKNILLKVLIFH